MTKLPDISEIPTSISELATTDRPRERLIASGPPKLTDLELLAVLIGTGRPGHSCLVVAHRLLSEYGSTKGIWQQNVSELCSVNGIGEVLAARIVAAAELARRVKPG